MQPSAFYDAGLLRQLATNLFYGWGYNFYRLENQLRADDQLVRTKAANLLGAANARAARAEAEYRRQHLALPSREHPLPDAAAIAAVQRLERLTRQLGAIEAALQHAPAPENDRMTQRYRNEAGTLRTLIQHDEQLVGQCELFRSLVAAKDTAALIDSLPELEKGLDAIQSTLRRREAVLLDSAP